MRRKLFPLISAASLLLFAATVVLWARSYSHDEAVCWRERWNGPPVWERSRLEVTYAERTMNPRFQRADVTRYWYDTDYELHLFRGRLGIGQMIDACEPRLNAKGPVRWERASRPGIGLGATLSPTTMWGITDFVNSYGNSVQREVTHTLSRSIPVWPVAVGTAVLPAVWLTRRARGRDRPGHCVACSYDITGNTSGVCPECGAAVGANGA
jgi:hypothetical protein